MNYWLEKTNPKNRQPATFTNYLSSPIADKLGRDRYRRMREVEIDDIVFHLNQDTNEIVGYSEIADRFCTIHIGPNVEYNINLHNFHEFSNPINIDDFLTEKSNLKLLKVIKEDEKKEVFYQKRNGRYYIMEGGYLTRLDYRIAKLLYPNITLDNSISPGTDEDEDAFVEGKIKYRLHKVRERNGKLVKTVKERFKRQNNGKLYCQCCKFDFVEAYGNLGENFIEAHHLIPVRSISEKHETLPKDIVLLCSNCHRMIHRYRPWINNPKDLKKILTL